MQAIPDQNFYYSKLAVLNTDTVQGTNLVRIKVNSADQSLKINQDDTISFTMVAVTPQDENYKDCLLFEGDVTGLLYPAVANASGELLVDI
mgnify:CR=1 FL=1